MKKISYLTCLALLAGCSSPTPDTTTQAPTKPPTPVVARHEARPAMQMPGGAPVKVAILVYPGAELLDFAGPAEVLSSVQDVQVYLVSTQDKQVATNRNVVHLTADYTLADAPQPDILVVPGGADDIVGGVSRDPAMINWIKKVDQGTQLTMSVCTGAFILSRAGLTHHKSITSHWSAVDSLQRFDPQATVLKDKRFVEDGKLLTTAGVSAGIDGALRVVEQLRGPAEAVSVAHLMQYDKWQPEAGVVIAKSGIRPPTALAADVARDPVCLMAVPRKAALALAYQGITYHFCSAGCRENFRHHPKDYVQNKVTGQ